MNYFDSEIIINPAFENSIAGEEMTSGIVGDASQDCYLVPSIVELFGQVIDPKILWPKMIGND